VNNLQLLKKKGEIIHNLRTIYAQFMHKNLKSNEILPIESLELLPIELRIPIGIPTGSWRLLARASVMFCERKSKKRDRTVFLLKQKTGQARAKATR